MKSRISATSTSKKSVDRFACCVARSPPGESTQPREKDERDDGVAVGRVPVRPNVAPGPEDVRGGGHADQQTADEEAHDDQTRHLDADVPGGTRVRSEYLQAKTEGRTREHEMNEQRSCECDEHPDVNACARNRRQHLVQRE